MATYRVNSCFALYRELERSGNPSYERMSDADIELLCSMEEADLNELDKRCGGYAFATLMLNPYSKNEFYRVLDILNARAPNAVFRWFIDYDGKRTDGRNPIDAGYFNLAETLDLIDKYYGSQYKLIYSLGNCGEYPTLVDHIIANDKDNGINVILEALGDRIYTKGQFDVHVLEGIWDEYYGECDEE